MSCKPSRSQRLATQLLRTGFFLSPGPGFLPGGNCPPGLCWWRRRLWLSRPRLSTWSSEQLRASFRRPRLLCAAVANENTEQPIRGVSFPPTSFGPAHWFLDLSVKTTSPRGPPGFRAMLSGTCSSFGTRARVMWAGS